MYYHPKCVGLYCLNSKDEGDLFNNGDNGELYMCPICKKNDKTVHKHVAQLPSCTEHTSGNEDSNKGFDRPEKDCSIETLQMIDTGEPTCEVKKCYCMMDCPFLPTSKFLTVDPPKEAQFKLSQDERNRIKPIAGQEHKFHFTRHFIQKPNCSR